METENKFMTSKIINFYTTGTRLALSGIWLYRIHCHHSYFFILEVVVFTEERHRWDKYDQNHVGSKAADGCSGGRS